MQYTNTTPLFFVVDVYIFEKNDFIFKNTLKYSSHKLAVQAFDLENELVVVIRQNQTEK